MIDRQKAEANAKNKYHRMLLLLRQSPDALLDALLWGDPICVVFSPPPADKKLAAWHARKKKESIEGFW